MQHSNAASTNVGILNEVCQGSAWAIRLSSQKGLFIVSFIYLFIVSFIYWSGTPFGFCLLSE
jgi:hypothetical protein